MKHSPENKRFFNAKSVFEVTKTHDGRLELHEVENKDTILPAVSEDGQSDDGFCQVINGKIMSYFKKDEIAYIPKTEEKGELN